MIGLCLLLCLSSAVAQQEKSRATYRYQLLKELEKCVNPGPQCDEDSVSKVAQLYEQGDKSVLPKLMDVAPKSDGALAEALGDFFSELLCHRPRTFLRAVAKRPPSEQDNLLILAAAADGSGMGCRRLDVLRHRLKAISRNRNDRLASLAQRCLAQVNKYNPAS